jgi:hypothetical protein
MSGAEDRFGWNPGELLIIDENGKTQRIGRVPKSAVEYEHPATHTDHCDACRSFVSTGACEIVDGVISEQDYCKLFERAQS